MAKHTPGWTEGGSSQMETEQLSRKKPVEKVVPVEKPAKAIKIMLRRHDKEPDDLV